MTERDCGYHRGDGFAHPCCAACDTLGCWYERDAASVGDVPADHTTNDSEQ